MSVEVINKRISWSVYLLFSTVLTVAVMYGFWQLSKEVSEDFLNTAVLDKFLLGFGIWLGLARVTYDVHMWFVREKRAKEKKLKALEDPLSRYETEIIEPNDISSLILLVSSSRMNITPIYLIEYFRPNQVVLISSDDESSASYAKEIHDYLSNSDKSINLYKGKAGDESNCIQFMGHRCESISENKNELFKCDFFDIDNVHETIGKASKKFRGSKSVAAVDLTGATALCSVGAAFSTMLYGIKPVYIVAPPSKRKNLEYIKRNIPDYLLYHIQPEDIVRLQEFGYDYQKTGSGIHAYKAPWSDVNNSLLDVIIKR